MSSNIKIKRICSFCGKEFIAQKTTSQSCSKRCASGLSKKKKREEIIKANNICIEKRIVEKHLKNFSLYSLRKGAYSLIPAYDMVSMTFVMPEDTEELALTLNGKKRKIKRSDFEIAMNKSGLETKIIEKLFTKFEKVTSKWFEYIDISFLPDEMKEDYKQIIVEKIEVLS